MRGELPQEGALAGAPVGRGRPIAEEGSGAAAEGVVGRARESANGWEGLQAVDAHRPQLAVVDLNMPVMSGFRFLRLLQREEGSDQSRVPVIIISGDDAAQAKELVMEVKPEGYLQKPFGPDELLERVEKLLESRE
ncbi:MAG: response regulator [Chloroflexota bacterium]